MVRSARAAITILVTAVLVVLAEWLDQGIVSDIVRQGQAMFDPVGPSWVLSLGTVAMAAVVLGLAVLAWRSRSALVGAVYAVAGGFLVFLPAIAWQFGAQVNDTPPVLPEPLPQALNDLWTWSDGPLNAVRTISGGMFVVGILVLGRTLLHRPPRPARESLPGFEGDAVRSLDAETIRP